MSGVIVTENTSAAIIRVKFQDIISRLKLIIESTSDMPFAAGVSRLEAPGDLTLTDRAFNSGQFCLRVRTCHKLLGVFMRFRWPFSKTYTITCPDGTPRIIHRNIDDAFPFALSDSKATGKFGLQLPDGMKANVDADIAKAIANITYEIDESNRSLMMDYRNAYIAFQTDPCGKSEWLTLQTEDIRIRRDRLQEQQRLLRTLVELATNRVASRQEMLEVLRKLVDRMSPNVATMITINEMDEAEKVAIEMADGTQ